MMKKLTLLAMAISALVALAVPAMASADTWTANSTSLGSTPVAIDGTGEMSATTATPLGTVRLGPCVVHVEGTISNTPTGVGSVSNFEITAPCPVSIGGTQICTIEEASSAGFPWALTVQEGTRIDISGANFTDVFDAECPLGPGAGASGTATGTYSNATSGIVFNGDGDMKTPLGGNVFLDGGVDLTRASDGALITLH